MNIRIKETNKLESLIIISISKGNDYFLDFFKQYYYKEDMCVNGNGELVMSQEEFNYWKIACKKQNIIDCAIIQLENNLDERTFEHLIDSLTCIEEKNKSIEEVHNNQIKRIVEYLKDTIETFEEEHNNYKRIVDDYDKNINYMKSFISHFNTGEN
jgi:hypothetical protein